MISLRLSEEICKEEIVKCRACFGNSQISKTVKKSLKNSSLYLKLTQKKKNDELVQQLS